MRNGRALAMAAIALLAMLGGVTPVGAAPGAITEFNLSPGFNVPRDITTGRDGNMWFTELVGNRVGRVTRSGAITEFPLAGPGRGPGDIVLGWDCALWFGQTEAATGVARMTTAGVVTEYPVANPGAHVSGVTVAFDGNIWLTETFANRIGRLETDKTNRSCAGRQF